MEDNDKPVNEFARRKLWEADDWLVLADEQFAEALPKWMAWESIAGAEGIGSAKLCLEEAYRALTEAALSDVKKLRPSTDLIDEDDPRCLKLLALHERLEELNENHPPSAGTMMADILNELRDLCRSLGFAHPDPRKP